MDVEAQSSSWRNEVPIWRELEASPIPESDGRRAPVVIVGAGPVGLALAIDLGMRGQNVVVLGRFDFVAGGSKAICFSKRSLDILDRLGIGQAAAEKGVIWNVGKVFWQDREEPVYQFDMLPVKSQKMPGFINIQQYHMEDLLIQRLAELPSVELRWGHDVDSVSIEEDGAQMTVKTASGTYNQSARWVVACDGSRSTVREQLGLEFEGRVFEDNFLIADIKMEEERPSERWFWFDPPFNPGQSALLHKQPDDIWRLDFQLGCDIDRDACTKPENVDPLIRALLGADAQYEPVWYSVYTFQCRRIGSFVHGPVIFAGDSAHLVSPFGARGCNGGLADIDNLGWKLDAVLSGRAGARLLESYNEEAIITADENILNSSRSTDFLTPKGDVSMAFRNAVLELSTDYPFARSFVNSGRLSTAVSYPNSSLITHDIEYWDGGVAPGSPVLDAPLGEGWLMDRLGNRFTLLANDIEAKVPPGVDLIDLADNDNSALVSNRYALAPGTAYLLRPDQYVAARFQNPTSENLKNALQKSMGN